MGYRCEGDAAQDLPELISELLAKMSEVGRVADVGHFVLTWRRDAKRL